jgi:toxoflavin synthase
LPFDYAGYGVKIKVEKAEEGSAVTTEIFENPDFTGPKLNEFQNYYWTRKTYQTELENQGFEAEWIDSEVSPEGIKKYGEEFWRDYEKNPLYVLIKARLTNSKENYV